VKRKEALRRQGRSLLRRHDEETKTVLQAAAGEQSKREAYLHRRVI